MANRWGKIDGQVLFSWAPKSLPMVTAGMKLKDGLLLGKKAMTNLDDILKSRDITMVCIVKVVVFLIYECESSTIKKTEH